MIKGLLSGKVLWLSSYSFTKWVAPNVKAFMLLGHGNSSAWQQVLNKDMQHKSYSKVKLKTVGGTEADKITGAERRVNVCPNGINAPVVCS
jgi:hypothetical protein